MSTRIYNGYRIPTMSLHELNTWIEPLRQFAKEETERYVYQKTVDESIYLLDEAMIKTKEEFEKGMEEDDLYRADSGIIHYVRRDLKRQFDSPFRGDLDVISKLVVLPIKGKTLCYLFTSDVKAIQEFFEKMPGVKEYGYWNNTDRPEHLSKKQWENRRDDWDVAVSYGDISKQGLVIDLVSDFPVRCSDKSAVQFPSFESRAKRVSTVLVEKDFIAELNKHGKKASFREVLDYFESEEGVLAMQERVKEMENILVKEPTQDTLLTKFNDCFRQG